MNNIQQDISYLKNIVEKREKYIHFSILGTAIGGILFCVFPFVYKQLAEFLGISQSLIFSLFAIVTWIIVTVLSVLEAKKAGRELFPKSIRYVLGNVVFVGYAFALANLLVFQIGGYIHFLLVFLATLGYGGLIWVSRMFLPRSIVWYGVFLILYPVILFLLFQILFLIPGLEYISGNLEGIYRIEDIIMVGVPFGIGHLAVALALFLQKKNTKN